MRVHTESGSVYEISEEEKRWKRLEGVTTDLRTEGGFYQDCSLPGTGLPMIIIAEPLTPGTLVRMITTSPVMAIEHLFESLGDFQFLKFCPAAILSREPEIPARATFLPAPPSFEGGAASCPPSVLGWSARKEGGYVEQRLSCEVSRE